MNNLKIELDPREDKKEQIYYLGKLNAPIHIDCSNGIAFLIFTSAEGEEELQIAFIDKEHQNFNQFYKKEDRIKVSLNIRKDSSGKIFYIGKIKADIIFNCLEGVSFVVFLSKQGHEELQIVAPYEVK